MIEFFFCILVISGFYFLSKIFFPNLGIRKFGNYAFYCIMAFLLIMLMAHVFKVISNFFGQQGLNAGFLLQRAINNMAERAMNNEEGIFGNVILRGIEDDDEIQNVLFAQFANDRAIPTEKLLQIMEIKTNIDGECGICYDDIKTTESVLACPQCNKSAHKDCLKQWFETGQNICVYCRKDLSTI